MLWVLAHVHVGQARWEEDEDAWWEEVILAFVRREKRKYRWRLSSSCEENSTIITSTCKNTSKRIVRICSDYINFHRGHIDSGEQLLNLLYSWGENRDPSYSCQSKSWKSPNNGHRTEIELQLTERRSSLAMIREKIDQEIEDSRNVASFWKLNQFLSDGKKKNAVSGKNLCLSFSPGGCERRCSQCSIKEALHYACKPVQLGVKQWLI